MKSFPVSINQLPGADLVAQGVDDLKNGTLSVEAYLVIIAAPALVRLGVELPGMPALEDDAELLLYRRLQHDGEGDAYSLYNSLLRTLVSFTRSYSQRVHDRSASSARVAEEP